MSAKTQKINQTQADVAQLQKAVPEVLADGSILQLAGSPVTKAAILAKLDAWAADFDQVPRLESLLAQARKLRDGRAAEAATFLGVLKPMLLAMLGPDHPELTRCAVRLRRPATPLTAEALVLRNARINATRRARGTLGKRQKAAIHGAVEAPSPAPTPVPESGTSH